MLPELELVPVDESVLEELVAVAVADTDPNDVTPPLEPGWGEARVTWLRDFHRRNRPGLVNGHQLTEAVRVNGRVSGAIRLESLSPVEVECGIWLARSARGRDLSHGVFSLIIERAIGTGAQRIIAHTTAGNEPAIAALRRAGAVLTSGPEPTVTAVIELIRDVPSEHSADEGADTQPQTASTGRHRSVVLPAGTINYVDTGGPGPVMVLTHGFPMDHLQWRKVVPLLGGVRCIMPTLPLGAHKNAMNLDADLSQLGQANILADFLEALELQDVTLVMNDWGGPQFVVALGRDERISRMAFVACEAFDNFPPPQARPAVLLTRAPGGAWLLMQLLRTPPSSAITDAHGGPYLTLESPTVYWTSGSLRPPTPGSTGDDFRQRNSYPGGPAHRSRGSAAWFHPRNSS